MNIFPIPAFSDNYLWVLSEGANALVVDPGDAAPVLRELEVRQLTLRAILVTHWHPDHIGGINTLKKQFDVPVYGPRAESARIPQLTQQLAEGDEISVLGRRFRVLETPGHTLGHIVYLSDDVLFCGDTLFSAGCGRLFEGTPAQMHHSLSRLAALPAGTRVYCTHEYTLSNLAFALAVEPGNADLRAYAELARKLRNQNQPTVPSTLARERSINPFLRSHIAEVKGSAEKWAGTALGGEQEVFAAVRRWKDGFKAA